MSVPKVCGIETEYGVAIRGAAEANPVLASSMLINAYVEHRKVGWDFEDESPGRDARGFAREGSAPPEIETHLVNTVLTNGARYYVDRAVPFATLVRHLLPWFVTRQVFTGAGKVGGENGTGVTGYQLSQRADFFEEEVGLETTLKRPIVNTRDEPHADPQKYRRLHVMVGDANLCEVATFLKVGTTAVVLAMIEDSFFDKDFSIVAPVRAMHAVSHDPTLRATVELVDGGSATALEL